MGKKIRTEEVDHLFEAILCLKNKEECYTLFLILVEKAVVMARRRTFM